MARVAKLQQVRVPDRTVDKVVHPKQADLVAAPARAAEWAAAA